MWVFANRLPEHYLIIAPRGLYASQQGGYGWHQHRENDWPRVDEFRPAVAALVDLLTPSNFPEADFEQLHLLGFSQGAALTYMYALLHPEKVISFAGLSGFLPDEYGELVEPGTLKDKPVFVAHGTQDDLVPVARARQAVEALEQAGAVVTYCEDDVGHKLSVTCFRGMEAFFTPKE